MRRLTILLSVLIASVSMPASPNDRETLKSRLTSCKQAVALEAAREVLDDPATLSDPVKLFTPSLVLFDQGMRDEAVFWFYAAQLRMRYQAVIRGGDYNQVLSVMLMSVGPPINTYAFQDTGKLSHILDQVLEWDRTTLNPLKVTIQSEELEKKLKEVYSGLDDLKSKLRVDKAALEEKAKQEWVRLRPILERPLTAHCPRDAQPINPPALRDEAAQRR